MLWVLGGAAMVLYAYQQDIPRRVWMAALPALLLEGAFYLAPGFQAVRERLARLKGWLAPLVVASAIAPYLIYSFGSGTFRIEAFGALLVLAATAVLWFRWAPREPWFDLLFLALMAGVFLMKVFGWIYWNPAGKPALDILGRMMWIRVGIVAVLIVRKGEPIDFGFLPRGCDWWVGVRYFVYSALATLPIALWTGFVHRRPVSADWRTAAAMIGTFLGFLLVVGLAEEFFFRGLLQPQLARLTGSFPAGLILASLVFGSVHLPYRAFPNWKFALLAAIAGVFYGLSYHKARSIRASTVTHALLVTTWRTWFV